MLFIRKALEAKKLTSHSLVTLLDKVLAGYEPARDHSVIHISDLSRQGATFCPREYALVDVTKKKMKGQYVSAAMRVAFDNGNALSDLCRNRWLEEEVVGNWRCAYCKFQIEFSKKPKTNCHKCKAGLWRYEEYSIFNKVLGVSGSIDFFIDFGTGQHVSIECKSMSKDEFKELKAPLGEHRLRTQLYLHHMQVVHGAHTGKVNLDYGKVLYISKGFGIKTKQGDVGEKVLPFKEFDVEANPDVATTYNRAEAVAAFRKGGKMPSGVCSNSFDKRGKSCAVLKECWSGSYPAGM